tara:strand:- start:12949 stop:13344 length:396 start_codon:yes stop_codon:yes gene_type:complete
MIDVVVHVDSSNNRVKERVERDLSYYDSEIKRMWRFRGGQIKMKYMFDPYTRNYRMMPTVEDLYEVKTVPKSNMDEINQWFEEYQNYNNTRATLDDVRSSNAAVYFIVPEDELEDFTYNMSRKGFRHEVRG